jgi:hypothetical protein
LLTPNGGPNIISLPFSSTYFSNIVFSITYGAGGVLAAGPPLADAAPPLAGGVAALVEKVWK